MFGTQYASVETSNELLADMPEAQPFGMGNAYPSYNPNQQQYQHQQQYQQQYQQQQQYRQMPQTARPSQMGYQTMPQYDSQPCGPCGERGENHGQPNFQQQFNNKMAERQFDNFNPHAQGQIPGFNPNRRRSGRAKRIKKMTSNNPILNMIEHSINSVMNALGVEPDWADVTEDGGAIWKQSSILKGKSLWGRVFSKIEVAGKQKPCPKPVPHYGCITTHTNMKLDVQLAGELQQELPMISYCPSTQLLSITMDTLEHNLAMLALVCGVQQDKLSYSKVKYYDLVKKYLGLTTPGNRHYRRGAKYSLVKFIHDRN